MVDLLAVAEAAAEAAAGRICYNYRYGFFIGVIFWQDVFSCDSEQRL